MKKLFGGLLIFACVGISLGRAAERHALYNGSGSIQFPDQIRFIESKDLEAGENVQFESKVAHFKGFMEISREERGLDQVQKSLGVAYAEFFQGIPSKTSQLDDSFVMMWEAEKGMAFSVLYVGLRKGMLFKFGVAASPETGKQKEDLVRDFNSMAASIILGEKQFSVQLLEFKKDGLSFSGALKEHQTFLSAAKSEANDLGGGEHKKSEAKAASSPQTVKSSESSFWSITGLGIGLLILASIMAWFLRRTKA